MTPTVAAPASTRSPSTSSETFTFPIVQRHHLEDRAQRRHADDLEQQPLLGPGTGLTPPFGANGVGIQQRRHRDVCGQYRVPPDHPDFLSIRTDPPRAARSSSPAINAPDGIAIDKHDNLWFCANQEDDIIVLDRTAR